MGPSHLDGHGVQVEPSLVGLSSQRVTRLLWVMQLVSTRAWQHSHSCFLKGMHLVTMAQTWGIQNLKAGLWLEVAPPTLHNALVGKTLSHRDWCLKVLRAVAPKVQSMQQLVAWFPIEPPCSGWSQLLLVCRWAASKYQVECSSTVHSVAGAESSKVLGSLLVVVGGTEEPVDFPDCQRDWAGIGTCNPKNCNYRKTLNLVRVC